MGWIMGWIEFIMAFSAFLFSHMLPTKPRMRRKIIDILGEKTFLTAYSILSVFLLGWIINAAGRAPFVPLWNWEAWQKTAPQIGMLIACQLIALSLGRPNPFSFGGSNNDAFAPSQPGILRLTRHPLLMALMIWAGSHIVPNGDLAHVIMFASFALFAAIGMFALDRRNQKQLGPKWMQLRQQMQSPPLLTLNGLFARQNLIRMVAGLLLYGGLLLLHGPVIGVLPY